MILLDVTWGVDPRRVLFASYTSACPVCGGEHSFIHSFVPHVPTRVVLHRALEMLKERCSPCCHEAHKEVPKFQNPGISNY